MSLRIVALAPPEHVSGRKDDDAINSSDPVSLFNALRTAAAAAEAGVGSWGESNWAEGRSRRRQTCLLMYSLDEMPKLHALLRDEQPNLVLIGAMSISMRGAVECALQVRERLGDDCLIVLGGRHASETVYRSREDDKAVAHHVASPLRLASMGRIPDVFDLVVGGEGEDVIFQLGEALARKPFNGRADRTRLLELIAPAHGEWAAGVLAADGRVVDMVSAGSPIDRNGLPSSSRLFGVSSAFDVFNGAYTAHVFSDTGQGCAFDCSFCSERLSVTGKPQDVNRAAFRLYGQMSEAVNVIKAQHGASRASAFVEDSILLLGKKNAISDFCGLMEQRPLPMKFGAQLTVDQILGRPAELKRLASVGLSYLFIGIETLEPYAIGGMSKDTSRALSPWAARIEEAVRLLDSLGIGVGAALLFGLGETPSSRMNLFRFLEKLRLFNGSPEPISMNWAVQHPLKGFDNGANYDYTDWPVAGSEMLDLFHSFGEASTEYPLPYVGRASGAEVRDVVAARDALTRPREAREARALQAFAC